MPAAGGLSSQYGMVDETTFGTAPTVTRFLEFNSETVEQTIDRIDSSGLRVGRRVERSTQWVPGKKNVTGDITFDVQQQGFGLLLKHMMGTIATTQPNAGSSPTVYEHKATVGPTDAKSFAFQLGLGDTGLTQRAKTYAGGKVAKWDLSCSLDQAVQLKITPDAISETTATAMAAATYAASTKPLVFTNAIITLPGGATGNVSKFDLTGDNAQALARWFLGSATKKEQLESGLRPYTGSIDVEFNDLSVYNLFTTPTTGALTAFFSGDPISGIYSYALEVTLPYVRFDGKTPVVPGPGIVTTTAPFVALDDGSGSGGVQMVYRTTDVTP